MRLPHTQVSLMSVIFEARAEALVVFVYAHLIYCGSPRNGFKSSSPPSPNFATCAV